MRAHRAAGLLVLLALAGCGGGGVDKAEYVTKADGACAPGNAAISAVPKPAGAAQVAAGAGTATGTIEAQVGSLRALETPGGDEKRRLDGIVTSIGEVGTATRALQDAAGRNDDVAMARATSEAQARSGTAADAASAYGLTQCGTGLKPALANLFEGTKSALKTSFVAKGEALCRESLRKSDALPQPGNSVAALGRFIDRYLPVYKQLIADFKALAAPPGDEAVVNELIGELEGVLPQITEIADAAKANNARLVGAMIEELDVAGTRIDAKLDAYGLKACGSLGGF